MNNGDKPASPSDFNFTNQLGKNVHEMNTGLTKREIFAMAAMQGLISCDNEYTPHNWEVRIAAVSVGMADALLKELSK